MTDVLPVSRWESSLPRRSAPPRIDIPPSGLWIGSAGPGRVRGGPLGLGAQRLDRGGGVVGIVDRRARHEHVRPRLRAALDGLVAHPAVHLQPDRATMPGHERTGAAQLREDQVQEGLAAKPRLHGHEQQHVDLGQKVGVRLDRGGGVERQPGAGTGRADHPQQPDRLAGGFRVHGDVARAGLRVGGGPAVGIGDHQVAVKRQSGVLEQRLHHRQADGEVGHEVIVHDVHMQPVGHAGDGLGLAGEPGKIGGQDARRHLDGHRAESNGGPAPPPGASAGGKRGSRWLPAAAGAGKVRRVVPAAADCHRRPVAFDHTFDRQGGSCVNSQAADPVLARVRKLLAKAESAGVTPAEAQALTAKAAELMAKYGIDRALLAAERPETDRPADRVIDVDNPWSRVQAHLLCGLASALRCQCVILPRTGPGSRIHMFGFSSDIERTDVLYTSLLVQMWQGLAAAEVPAWSRSSRAWRRSWLLGFATAVVARVRAAEDAAARRATAPEAGSGSQTALVLADRALVIRRNIEQAYPVTRKSQVTYSGNGYGAGYTQGQRADIGTTRLRRGSARALTG